MTPLLVGRRDNERHCATICTGGTCFYAYDVRNDVLDADNDAAFYCSGGRVDLAASALVEQAADANNAVHTAAPGLL